MRLNVLLVAGGGFQGQSLVDAIRLGQDVRVIVADSVADNIGRFVADCYRVAPPLSDERSFREFIEALVQEERVDLVLPCTNRELVALASIRDSLEKLGARVAVSERSLLDILADKLAVYQALQAANIPVQRVVPLTAEATLPLFGKPRSGWGGIDTRTLRTAEDLNAINLVELASSHCWVPWLEHFEEVSADFAIGFGREISRITLRRRVRTSGGFAVISDSIHDESVHGIVREVADWLAHRGGVGIFNVQVLRGQDGALYVSDINPRHGTSSGHAAAEGNHLVAFLMQGKQPEYIRPVRTVRELGMRAIPLPEGTAWAGVVFDLDDTLIDHKRWMMDRLRLASVAMASIVDAGSLLRAGYIAVEEGPHDRLIDIIVDRLGIPQHRDRLLEAYRSAVPARAEVFPEVRDVLRELRRMGIRIGLLTDNPPASQQAKLRAMDGMEQMFDAVVFSREHGGEKPGKQGFDEVASRLGLPPSSLLMVGDHPWRDAIGALEAGYAACMLVSRQGTRFNVNSALLGEVFFDVSPRIWSDRDLRALPFIFNHGKSGL
ncbi:HAD-IA family hydrolase [Dyella silvae]|uniref:HAD-IA family hydrolase n=1 Tax=Dyella silvae TaxID=2994424 RepID=UPI002263B2D7|nr:HAD-IA family hydrolase [Dyella silvae]